MNIKDAPSGSKLLAARDAWNAIRNNPKASAADKEKVKAEYRRHGGAVSRELRLRARR